MPTVRNSGPFWSREIPAAVIPGVQVLFETRMAGHLVTLATFFMQSQPPTLPVLEVVANLHGDRGADPSKAVNHGPDQRAVAKAY